MTLCGLCNDTYEEEKLVKSKNFKITCVQVG